MQTSSPERTTTTTMTYAAALADGLYEVMRSDPRTGVVSGGIFGLTPYNTLFRRIAEAFPDRILEPPYSEASTAALGAGAAMVGQRLLVNFSTAAFSLLGISAIANEAAVARYMSGGQLSVPVVYYALHGVRGGGGPQHSSSIHSVLWNCPGLEIVMPSDPADAKGLLIASLQSDNPTAFITHSKLFGREGPVPAGLTPTPLGVADVKRPGRDVTIVAISYMVPIALDAAATLAERGIEAEVVDPRTLVPLDEATILASVARTGRLLVVDEAPLRCGAASEIAATVAERGFAHLKAAPVRIARADVPTPFSPPLEAEITPNPQRIVEAVVKLVAA